MLIRQPWPGRYVWDRRQQPVQAREPDLARVQELDAKQRKLTFVGAGSKKKFERRLNGITALGDEVNKLLPGAGHQTYLALAGVALDAYSSLGAEIETTPSVADGCSPSTVCAAIKQLEAAGLMTWVHRLKRVREHSGIDIRYHGQGGLAESERT